jgi:uncharacterized membrane protein
MRLVSLLALLILSGSSFQAFVHGSIYAEDLEKLNSSVVRVEGPFSYQLVVDKSDYSIFLPEGTYMISASHHDDTGGLALYAEEKIVVGSHDQEVDLVLKPPGPDSFIYAGLILIVAVFFLWSNHFWQGERKEESMSKEALKPMKHELDEDAKSVLSVLDGCEGRATQKELRQNLGFSDSKLSLILTELEQLGLVKRFKRGRANIVRKL